MVNSESWRLTTLLLVALSIVVFLVHRTSWKFRGDAA
jgi:hypothetical protein